jgi:heme/copper-type cytochrome/quinol oxidase subunit 3
VAYLIMRGSTEEWPAGTLSTALAAVNTAVLAAAVLSVWRARGRPVGEIKAWLAGSAFLAFVFTVLKLSEYRWELILGLVPTASPFQAIYVSVTALHLIHIIGGGIGNARAIAAAADGQLEQIDGRVRALAVYWSIVGALWAAILLMFYLT